MAITRVIGVLDIDGCSHANLRTENELCPHLVDFVKNEFSGFYLCTARYTSKHIGSIYPEHKLKAEKAGRKPELVLTHLVAKNLEAETGQTCLGISTADDNSKTAPKELHLKVGYGFKHFMLPAELAVVRNDTEEKISNTTDHVPLALNDDAYKLKQDQIKQIAHLAAFTYPNDNIILKFIDDKLDICNAILSVPTEDISANVSIIAYNHVAGKNEFTKIGEPLVGKGQFKFLQKNSEPNYKLKVYIAGPDVFLPNAVEYGKSLVAIAERHGYEGLFPLDNEIQAKSDWTSHELGIAIFKANIDLMQKADFIVANMTPFRGPGMDQGTAFEMAYMLGLERWGQVTPLNTLHKCQATTIKKFTIIPSSFP